MATPRMVKALIKPLDKVLTGGKNKNVTFKMRECLNPECKKRFLSEHSGVRFCTRCKSGLSENYYDIPHRVYI